MHCPLCASESFAFYHEDTRRPYHQCGRCRLVFIPPSFRLSARDEKLHYDLHQNDPRDSGYRKFLSRLFEPMCERVPAPAQGLDFGSGPGPTLSVMFAEAGYDMVIYDPCYADDASMLQRRYDFITASEVAEHLYAPGEVLAQLFGLLKPGGWLGLMTKLVIDQAAFADWHYKNDPTHVCFYSRETLQWWAQRMNCDITFIGRDVILLRKPLSGCGSVSA